MPDFYQTQVPFFDTTHWCSWSMPGFKVWAQPGPCCRGGLSMARTGILAATLCRVWYDLSSSSRPSFSCPMLPPTSNCQDGASHMIPNGTSSWFLSWTLQRKTWPFWGKEPYHLGAGDQGNRRLTVHDATERWDFETGAMDGQWSMMLIGFFSDQNAGILNRVSIPFKLTFKANKFGVQMAMVRHGPTLQLGPEMFRTGGSITSRGKEKGRDLHGPWSTRNERVGVRRGDADASGDGVIPLSKMVPVDVSGWFMHVYICLCLFGHFTPFFFDKGMARKSPSISFLGHRASQNHVVATSTMQDFADQGSVLLLGRDEKNVFFRGGRNPRWKIDYQGRTYSVWLLMNKIHKFI